jgi:hypothetical protein
MAEIHEYAIERDLWVGMGQADRKLRVMHSPTSSQPWRPEGSSQLESEHCARLLLRSPPRLWRMERVGSHLSKSGTP